MSIIKNKKIINIITSGGQVFLVGVIYYFLYKFLLIELGVKLLGVWSVVMSASSLANIADLGISTSMVRFVSLYEHNNNLKKIPNLVFTGVILNMLFFIPICLIIFPTAYFILPNVIEKEYVSLARELLPFSLCCILINSISGVYGSILDGFRKNYLRNFLLTISSVLFLISSIFLVKKYGLIGVVWAQIFQSLFSLIGCLFISIKIIQYNPFKWNWSKSIFNEIIRYGIKFQLTSLTGVLNEPITKMLLSRFGGLAFTGYYEMANKLVMQIRGAIVAGNQSLMPYLVKENISEEKSKFSILEISFAGVFVISLFILSILNISSNWISNIWILHYEPIFIKVLLCVSISMFINLLSAPVYFALLSYDKLRPIIVSQSAMVITNLTLGFCFGYFFKGYGIVFSWMITVIVGSVILIASLKTNDVLGFLFKNKLYFITIFIVSLFFVSVSYLLHYNFIMINIAYISVFSVIILDLINRSRIDTIK